MSDSLLQKAQLVPIDPKSQRVLLDQAIDVHFNPETLKISYAVQIKADTGSKNSSSQPAQQSSVESVKLAVDLVFDTTDKFEKDQDEADVVKVVTGKIVSAFVAPPQPDGAPKGKPIPAKPCLFIWGTFQFMGLVDSYSETLEFFSASGVPLRSAVSLSLKQNRYKVANIPQRKPGVAQPLPAGKPVAPAMAAAGQDPADWRGAALANGLESPRFSPSAGLNVGAGAALSASASASGGAGFSVGASASLGTSIPGAFSSSSVVSSSGAGFSAGASFGASIG
jgi:hypothetical protein